jgi:hypothetical protein
MIAGTRPGQPADAGAVVGERAVKSVHRDVKILVEEEFIDRDEAGRIYLPFDRIHAEFGMAGVAA